MAVESTGNGGLHYGPHPAAHIKPRKVLQMKMKLMQGNALAKLIGAIGAARVTLDEQVQVACLQVIGQSIVHRNTTPANSLLEAVSKHHKATLVVYLERFGNFAWDKKAENLAFKATFPVPENAKPEEYLNDHVESVIGEARWFDAKKAAAVISEYDARKVIGDVLDRLFKKASKGVAIVNKDVLDATHAAYCAAVAKQYDTTDRTDEKPTLPLNAEQVKLLEAAQRQQDEADAGKLGVSTQKLAELKEHFGKQPQMQLAA